MCWKQSALSRQQSARVAEVILFLNGPFGVGKSSVAKVLTERVPNAMLYDPEVIGSILQRFPIQFKKVHDFQDYALWRTLVVEVARLLRKASARPLVIPLSVWRRDYFDSITSGLRRVDPDLACFHLTASREALYAWRMSHVEVCLAASRDPALGVEIRTDDRTPAETADAILETLKGTSANKLQSKV